MIAALLLAVAAAQGVGSAAQQSCLLDKISPPVRTQLAREFRIAAGAAPGDASLDRRITTKAIGDAVAGCAVRYHWSEPQIESASGWLTVAAITPVLRELAAGNGLDFAVIERVAGRLLPSDRAALTAELPSEPDLSTTNRLAAAAKAEGISLGALEPARLTIFGNILGAIIERDGALKQWRPAR